MLGKDKEAKSTTYSIVVPLEPSTNLPSMNRPVENEVFPLCAAVSNVYSKLGAIVIVAVVVMWEEETNLRVTWR